MGTLSRSLALVVMGPLLSSCGVLVFLSGGEPGPGQPDAAEAAEDGGRKRGDGGARPRDAGADDAASADDDAGPLDGGPATDAGTDVGQDASTLDAADLDAADLDAADLDAADVDAAGLDGGDVDAGPIEPEPPWPDGFSHRMKLTFLASPSVGALTDFPVLVRLPASFPFELAGQDGAGLAFTDEDGVTQLRHDVDTWGASSGFVWVKVPDLVRDGADHIWLYFGGPLPPPPPPPSDVWSNGFAAVWHLGGDLSDASAQVPDFTNYGAALEAVAVSGAGTSFSGDTYLETISSALSLPSEWTLELWVKFASITPGTYTNMLIGAAGYDGGYLEQWPYWLNMTGSLRPNVYWTNANNVAVVMDATASGGVVLGVWHHVAATKASDGTVSFFFDGAPLGSEKQSAIVPVAPETVGLRLGRSPGSTPFSLGGAIDEVRLSKVNRDDAWMHATMSTAKDQLIDYGDVQGR